MTQWQLAVDLIAIPPACADAFQILACLEVCQDALDGALGDPNHFGDLAQRRVRMARNGQQDMPMVADECPAGATNVWRFQTHGLTLRGIHDKRYTTGMSHIKLGDFPSRPELEVADHEARWK
jgi:hypothetical protein